MKFIIIEGTNSGSGQQAKIAVSENGAFELQQNGENTIFRSNFRQIEIPQPFDRVIEEFERLGED